MPRAQWINKAEPQQQSHHRIQGTSERAQIYKPESSFFCCLALRGSARDYCEGDDERGAEVAQHQINCELAPKQNHRRHPDQVVNSLYNIRHRTNRL